MTRRGRRLRWATASFFFGTLAWAGCPGPLHADEGSPGRISLGDFGKRRPKIKKPRAQKKPPPPPEVTAPPATPPGGKRFRPVGHGRIKMASPHRVRRLPPHRPSRPPVPLTPGTYRFTGYVRHELSQRAVDPRRPSKLLTRSWVALTGRRGPGTAFRVSGRFAYNSVFDVTDDYPSAVARDERAQAELHEAFVDLAPGPLELRLGKQQIVWGEVIGAFVADQVNAKDYRDFLLPDFDSIRLPDWAADVEYSLGGFHAEVVWIPFPGFDRLPRAGSEFAPAGMPTSSALLLVKDPEEPPRTLRNDQRGARLSLLLGGVDMSVFALRTWDKSPVYFTSLTGVIGLPPFSLTPRYQRLKIYGGTVSYEWADVVWKGEMAYYDDRGYTTVSPPWGWSSLLLRDAYAYVLGADTSRFGPTNLSLQFQVQAVKDHTAALVTVPDSVSRFLAGSLRRDLGTKNLKGELSVMHGLHRSDLLVRPGLTWTPQGRWTLKVGLNFFEGDPQGLFGQFDANDNLTASVQFNF